MGYIFDALARAEKSRDSATPSASGTPPVVSKGSKDDGVIASFVKPVTPKVDAYASALQSLPDPAEALPGELQDTPTLSQIMSHSPAIEPLTGDAAIAQVDTSLTAGVAVQSQQSPTDRPEFVNPEPSPAETGPTLFDEIYAEQALAGPADEPAHHEAVMTDEADPRSINGAEAGHAVQPVSQVSTEDTACDTQELPKVEVSQSSDAPNLRITSADEAPSVESAQPSTEDDFQVDDRLVAHTEPGSLMAEEYRAIRTSLLARWEHKRHLVHTITSATPQEGKSITSLNLGLSLSELTNRKTVVVEADLRLPTFSKLLNIESGVGLHEVLENKASIHDVIRTAADGGLSIITAGARAGNDAVQLLSSNTMSKVLKILRAKFDHVIIDTPPVLELADAGILGAMSDDVLLVVRLGRTPRSFVEHAVRTLTSYNASVSGVIATDQQRLRQHYYYYRYGYRYQYHRYAKAA